jgi:hypothetical protein
MRIFTSGVSSRIVISPVIYGKILSKTSSASGWENCSISVLLMSESVNRVLENLGIMIGVEHEKERVFQIILDEARFNTIEVDKPLRFQLKAIVPFTDNSELEVILWPE